MTKTWEAIRQAREDEEFARRRKQMLTENKKALERLGDERKAEHSKPSRVNDPSD